MIKDFSWLDVNLLNRLEDEITDICIKYKDYISYERSKAIITFFRKRMDYVIKYLNLYVIKDDYYSKLDLDILDYLKANKIIRSIDSLIPIVNKSHITIQRSLNRLAKVKRIKRVGANKNGYWTIIE